MSDFLARQLEPLLLEHAQAPGWCVAFSGGLDSTVLLHMLAGFVARYGGPPLRALHVHHGLQQVADAWPEHCRYVCEHLGLPLQVVPVHVAEQASTEQAARDARYAAFEQSLKPGELLMLGQHQDDQAETLLLRLLRGAGVAGLRAMPAVRELGQGRLLRPLLTTGRLQLEAYAERQGLCWIEDPSNQSDDYDRNFLRNRVMPLLQQRWPGGARVLQRTAQHMSEAQQLLNELAQQDLQGAHVLPGVNGLPLPSLDLEVVREWSFSRQKNVLRYWLESKGRAVDAAHWAGWHSLLQAGPDAQPCWQLDQGALLRHRQRVYWVPNAWLQQKPVGCMEIRQPGNYELAGNGWLVVAGHFAAPLQVRYRQGGETMQLAGRGRRDLKRLLQEQDVPAFVRQRLPLLFYGEQLVAVASFPALYAAGWEPLRVDWHAPGVE